MKTVPGGNAGELPIFQEAAQLFFPFFFISWKANKSIVQLCNNSTGNSGKKSGRQSEPQLQKGHQLC